MLKFLKDCLIEPEDDTIPEMEAAHNRVALYQAKEALLARLWRAPDSVEGLQELANEFAFIQESMLSLGLKEYSINDDYKFVIRYNCLTIEKGK